jgi:ribosomal protein S18 acetylase RimI-like enzyme
MNYNFRKARTSEISQIWDILQKAINRRKEDNSNQWQDGYPNIEILQKDIEKEAGFVLAEGEDILGYCAILINDEPQYNDIKGKWLTNGDFVVFHRIAISEKHLRKGLAKMLIQKIEDFALKNKIYSIKADTNYDNIAMIKIFESLGYELCGEVYFRGNPRNAYEKVLANPL